MQKNIWIVVADGARATIFNYQGPHYPLQPVDNGELRQINKPSRELVTTERGRVFHSADGARSAMERPTDPHEYEKWRFAVTLSNFIHVRNKQFNSLIVIAPPKMLGNLRQNLSEESKEKIIAEVDKDLTNVSVQDLPKHLQHIININS